MPPLNNKPLTRTALEPVCEALANVIRQRRKASGLSLNELAELTRLSRQMISFIETSRRIPTIDSARASAARSEFRSASWLRTRKINYDYENLPPDPMLENITP